MDSSVNIKLPDIFDKDHPYDIAVARLVIISRQASTLRELLKKTHSKNQGLTESSIVLFTYYIGAVKELLDAFHHLYTSGPGRAMAEENNSLTDIRDNVRHASQHLDKKNPNSLYSRFLKRVRDSGAFHIKNKDISHIIGAMHDLSFPSAETVGAEQKLTAIPWVAAALALISCKDMDDFSEAVDATVNLHQVIEEVAYDLYLINVRLATESPDNSENER